MGNEGIILAKRSLEDVLRTDSSLTSLLGGVRRSMESVGKRFKRYEIEKLGEKVINSAFDHKHLFGATIISIDGLKASGKSTLRKKLQSDLENIGIKTYFFKESHHADHDAKKKWTEFRRNYGYGGDPLESVALVSEVRVSAFARPEVQSHFQDSRTVVLYERTYIYTLACALASALTEYNLDRPDIYPFMDEILDRMNGTYVIPDLSLLLQVGYKTMSRRVRGRERNIGREEPMPLPPRNVGRALFQLGENSSFGEGTILPNIVRIETGDKVQWSDSARCAFFELVYDRAKSEVYNKLREKGFPIDDK